VAGVHASTRVGYRRGKPPRGGTTRAQPLYRGSLRSHRIAVPGCGPSRRGTSRGDSNPSALTIPSESRPHRSASGPLQVAALPAIRPLRNHGQIGRLPCHRYSGIPTKGSNAGTLSFADQVEPADPRRHDQTSKTPKTMAVCRQTVVDHCRWPTLGVDSRA